MISVNCYNCKTELSEPGALVFSPPDLNDNVFKRHLCIACYINLERWLNIGKGQG